MAPASKKRKRSMVETNKATTTTGTVSASNPPSTPTTTVALPPPMVPYHFIPYPVYHPPPHPYYLPIHPPISPRQSPTLTSSTSSSNQPRILPKTPNSNAATSPAAAFYTYHPYQVSPQLHPGRHNSISSTTADEREQARKISHSAIERRRRERINDKIAQLKQLIPSCADRHNLHKMTVLQSAIDYIVYLRKVVQDLGKDPDQLPPKIKSKEPEQQQQQEQSTEQLPPPQIGHEEEEEDDDEDDEESWSTPCSPTKKQPSVLPTPPSTGLKPMDLLTNHKKTQELPSPPSSSSSTVERNMNLENLLC
ncbi:hypothetical protein RMATCC62417_01133 [Rhizopus microsporus]|nr:hypothetical protein RMATCC62417_01133 [Rhizopus microsporus]